MNKRLTQPQRIIAAILYLLLIGVSFSLLGGNFNKILDSGYDKSIWFYSGVLLIIMGQYVTEPFFSTPADSLANSLTLIFALLTVNKKEGLIGYDAIFYFSISLTILSIIAILCKDKETKFSNILFIIIKRIGSSKFIYSIVYLLSSYSYFANKENMSLFIVSIAIWICIVFFGLAERIIKFVSELKSEITSDDSGSFIGYAVKCDNTNLFTIQLGKLNKHYDDYQNNIRKLVLIKISEENYSVGIVIRRNILLENIWLDVSLIIDTSNAPVIVNKNDLTTKANFMKRSDKIGATRNFSLNLLKNDLKKAIEESYLYKKFENFIGFIEQGSNINTICFSILKNPSCSIKDGSIVSTTIYGEEVIYQVINGITVEENKDSNSTCGYIRAIARKLGVYDYKNYQLKIVKWIPNMGESVYLHVAKNDISLKSIANTSIGRMPETDMQIPIKDINSLVTYNTAILGILGVGKSCLTFELIKKVTANNIKCICIDITNQYATDKGLLGYISGEYISKEICDDYLELLENYSKQTGANNQPAKWGNVQNYKACLKCVIKGFIESDKKVLVLNPEKHPVTKPASLFNITELVELSVVEKTRIISEVLLEICMEKGQSDFARCCLVYEEAHSLVPEWNSVANSGDDRAANGTAKVILQGRKYGLGCIIITQRTANVTKSILNQCNTVFALRIFDDTGKTFLENYIGKDYSDTLPTLEERHAIAIGRALKLKQPVIIQLNDMKYLKLDAMGDSE